MERELDRDRIRYLDGSSCKSDVMGRGDVGVSSELGRLCGELVIDGISGDAVAGQWSTILGRVESVGLTVCGDGDSDDMVRCVCVCFDCGCVAITLGQH